MHLLIKGPLNYFNSLIRDTSMRRVQSLEDWMKVLLLETTMRVNSWTSNWLSVGLPHCK